MRRVAVARRALTRTNRGPAASSATSMADTTAQAALICHRPGTQRDCVCRYGSVVISVMTQSLLTYSSVKCHTWVNSTPS